MWAGARGIIFGRTTIQDRPRRRMDLVAREMQAEVLLYDSKKDSTHLLNPMATAIWEMCDGTRTPEEIAQVILQALPTDRKTVLADVKRVIREFSEKGLLRQE